MNEVLENLLDKYLTDSLSKVEQEALSEMIASQAFEGQITEYIDRYIAENSNNHLYQKQREVSYAMLSKEIARRKKVVRMQWVKKFAVAAIFLLAIASTYLFLTNKKEQPAIAKVDTKKQDVQPGKTGAILKLDDGTTIVLDTAKNGKITSNVEKSDASVTVADEVMQYATLTTPRARQQQLVLADGSKVWLNAGSSIRFPTAFKGNERRVEITGEAYFEVAKNAAKPFIVSINNTSEVEVLGTHFNVMAYTNEPSLQTTLLEGSVKFRNGTKSVVLKPGEQSLLSVNGNISVNSNADIDEVMAWKNGLQTFHSANLQSIMRQVERWYDVDVVYETNLPKDLTFTGDGISRNVSLAELLKVFESKEVKFEIDAINKKVKIK